jgi:hypothetical protein
MAALPLNTGPCTSLLTRAREWPGCESFFPNLYIHCELCRNPGPNRNLTLGPNPNPNPDPNYKPNPNPAINPLFTSFYFLRNGLVRKQNWIYWLGKKMAAVLPLNTGPCTALHTAVERVSCKLFRGIPSNPPNLFIQFYAVARRVCSLRYYLVCPVAKTNTQAAIWHN